MSGVFEIDYAAMAEIAEKLRSAAQRTGEAQNGAAGADIDGTAYSVIGRAVPQALSEVQGAISGALEEQASNFLRTAEAVESILADYREIDAKVSNSMDGLGDGLGSRTGRRR
ncbi:hypothetical protein AB0I28_37535 [Phytomonospora sp. NPDC050363]|uniref:hypothetical protein n=1 Tax=Phytomonospora sp. NPDC050363 TaxID=3155642 RepID=UPI0033F902D4